MSFELPKLSYDLGALSPHLSKETLEFHYGKHHQAYVTKLNTLVEGKAQAKMSLEEVIMNSEGPVFNNAAQIWNHTFYWNGFSPKSGQEPGGALAQAINKDFGSFDKFKSEFTDKATNLFGSGWTWLVKSKDGKLAVTQTSNADLPMKHNQTALLTCDVWEHAYYIDYRNLRPKYLESFWSLVNWDFVQKNLES
ncbi:MAG: superoxide dismutase [Fe] [Deltaproteobacteria bacterium CG11_big_fil_rev_8_21_14_0_20_45_16]|nr:MAG: superoxide dismutase [Fe] [Deltaproteobacteria bacterium CG11_big_fil_rev_8_21_14_0_20_45_16]